MGIALSVLHFFHAKPGAILLLFIESIQVNGLVTSPVFLILYYQFMKVVWQLNCMLRCMPWSLTCNSMLIRSNAQFTLCRTGWHYRSWSRYTPRWIESYSKLWPQMDRTMTWRSRITNAIKFMSDCVLCTGQQASRLINHQKFALDLFVSLSLLDQALYYTKQRIIWTSKLPGLILSSMTPTTPFGVYIVADNKGC